MYPLILHSLFLYNRYGTTELKKYLAIEPLNLLNPILIFFEKTANGAKFNLITFVLKSMKFDAINRECPTLKDIIAKTATTLKAIFHTTEATTTYHAPHLS